MLTKLKSYWATIFVLPLTFAKFTEVCNETYSSTQGLQCFPCQPGYAKTDDCSTNQTHSLCMQCNEGTYQSHCIHANEAGECKNCTKCVVYKQHCTIYQNAVCGESAKDSSDDNWDQTWVILIVTLWAFATLLFATFLSTCLYRKRRMRRRHSSYNNINDNSEYKHHDLPDLPGVVKTKDKSYLNLHTISEDVSKGMSFTSNDFSEQDNLTLPEVGKRKDEDIFTWPTNTWKRSKEISNNRNNEGKTNSGTHLSLAENLNVDIKELAKSEEEGDTENRNNEGQIKNDTQLPLTEKQNVDVKELVESKEKEKNVSKWKTDRISIIVPVAVVPPSQDKLTRESFQSSADGENAQENTSTENRGNGQTNKNTQLSPAGNQNGEVKELAEYEKQGTQTLKIDWQTIFLKLVYLFPPAEWEMFGIHLLSNCQRVRDFNAYDAVAEIKLETRSQYCTGWIRLSYFKVFNKWLQIMGHTEASIEQIEQAVSETIDSKEIMDRVSSIRRDPPILPSFQSLVPKDSEHIGKNELPNVQQCFALHDSEIPGAACSVQHSSRQMHSIQASRCCTCSTFVPNVAELQEGMSNCQAVQTSFQYNTLRYATNGTIEYQTPYKQNDRGKKRKRTSSKLQDKRKLRKLESYARDKAKQTLLSDHKQFHQFESDYDIYMEYVIDLLMKECKVIRKVVLSITYQAFCEVKEIRTSQNEMFYLLYGGKPRLCLTRDVYDDLAVDGKSARPKLIAYLDEQKVKYNKLDVDTFLFISFKGDAVFGQMNLQRQRERKVMNPAIINSLQIPVSTESSKDFDTSNIDATAGPTSTVACQTEDVNNNPKPENPIQDEEIIEMNKTYEKVSEASPSPCERDASELKWTTKWKKSVIHFFRRVKSHFR